MKDYKIYYSDGNVRIFSSKNVIELMKYLIDEPIQGNENIIKIELRD